MTEESRILRDLAGRVMAPYLGLPGVRAAMVMGSVAEGESDRYSDVDMAVYYEESLPTEAQLDTARETGGGSALHWTLGDRNDGGLIQAYFVHGIEFQIVHSLVVKTDETIVSVQSGEEIGTPLNKALSGIAECKALFGSDLIDEWKARIGQYPDELRVTSVRKYLNFTPLWGLVDALVTRDGTIWRHQILVENTQNLIGVLAALNRLYFTTFQFKRMARFVNQMTIKPDDFTARVESAFTADPTAASVVLRDLVIETVALVEEHLPSVDTSAVRKRVEMARKRWEYSGI